MNMQRHGKGFTLMEIMITFIIMIILASIFPLANYMGRLQYLTDTKKRADLKELNNVLEVFYRQKSRYPSLDEMGYWNNGIVAYVCGDKYIGSSIRSFAHVLPCSPADDTGNPYVYFPYNNQQDFVLFVNLDERTDPAIELSGCSGGCTYFISPTELSSTFYNYAVYSSLDYMRSSIYCPADSSFYCSSGACALCSDSGANCHSKRQVFCVPEWCNPTTCN